MSRDVAVETLTVAHGAVPAVRAISFTARRGELLTLLGPSGCGKTTTLRAIAGLETPRQGRIAIGGNTVFDAARSENLRARASWARDDVSVLRDLAAHDCVRERGVRPARAWPGQP